MKHINWSQNLLSEKHYGVYLEFVVPKTVFYETKALSEKDAELSTLNKFKDTPGIKILHVFPIENTPTYMPKEPSKLIAT